MAGGYLNVEKLFRFSKEVSLDKRVGGRLNSDRLPFHVEFRRRSIDRNRMIRRAIRDDAHLFQIPDQ